MVLSYSHATMTRWRQLGLLLLIFEVFSAFQVACMLAGKTPPNANANARKPPDPYEIQVTPWFKMKIWDYTDSWVPVDKALDNWENGFVDQGIHVSLNPILDDLSRYEFVTDILLISGDVRK